MGRLVYVLAMDEGGLLSGQRRIKLLASNTDGIKPFYTEPKCLFYPGANFGKWIPCSKHLPKKPEENPEFENRRLELYLVCLEGCKYPFRAFWDGEYFSDGYCRVSATAWMPLPEPFKENYE